MSINKNFVVKNGFEVNTDLLLANATIKRVGIATTQPGYTLDVAGGIGVTNLYVSGISTFRNEFYVRSNSTTVFSALGVGGSVGVGTALPAYLLDIRSPVSSGQTALYVQGDVRLTGDLLINDLTVADAYFNTLNVSDTLFVSGIATFGNNLNVGGATTTEHIQVIGVSTIGSLSASGISTFNNNVNISGVTTSRHLRVIGVSTVDSLFSSGISTFNNNVNIAGVTTSRHIQVTGVSTIGSLSASGIATITNNLNIAGVTTTQHLQVTGVSTIGTGVTITSGGNINAVSGVVTATRFVGSGTSLTGNARNLTATIGIGTTGGVVGYAVSFINFVGPSISTSVYNSNAGIATIFFIGERGNVSMAVSNTPPPSGSQIGDLWFNIDDGRTYLYYDEVVVGSGTDAYWVDASPFNVGILTEVSLSFVPGSSASPSWYFDNSATTGVFSPAPGQITFVSVGSSILNINSGVSTLSSNLVVSGVSTFNNGTYFKSSTYYNQNPVRAYFGNSNEMSIFSTGTYLGNSYNYIDATSGYLDIRNLRTTIRNPETTTQRNLAIFDSTTFNGEYVELYYGGSKKFETIGAGVTITGVTVTNHLNVTGVTTTRNINAGIVTATEFDVSTSTFNASGINVTGIITASSDIRIGSSSLTTVGKSIAMAMVFG